MNTAAPLTNLQRLEALEKRCEEQAQRIEGLEKTLAAIRAVFVGAPAASEGASDRELDGQYGDPDVKMIPHDWTGTGVTKGQKLSRCPAEFLDVYAASMGYFAKKNDEKGAKDNKGRPKSHWDRQAASLARGWARRIRAGWAPPAPAPAPAFPGFGGAARFGAPAADASSDPFAMPPPDWRNRPFGKPVDAPAPAAPPPPPSALAVDEDDEDTSFNFGANLRPAATAPAAPSLDDDDDDWPDEGGEAAQ